MPEWVHNAEVSAIQPPNTHDRRNYFPVHMTAGVRGRCCRRRRGRETEPSGIGERFCASRFGGSHKVWWPWRRGRRGARDGEQQ